MQVSKRFQAALAEPLPILLQGAFACAADLYDPITNPNGKINMGTAENRTEGEEMAEKLKTCLAIEAEDLLYGNMTGSPELRSEIANLLQRHLVIPGDDSNMVISPDDLSVHNGMGGTIELLMQLLVDPGEGILIPSPLYGGFLPDIQQRTGGVVVPVHTEAPHFALSFENLEKTMTEYKNKTGKDCRVLIVCHPNNPIGQSYSEDAVKKFAAWGKSKGLWVLYDEIYALSTFRQDVPQLNVYDTEVEAQQVQIEFATAQHQIGTASTPGPRKNKFYSSFNLPEEYHQTIITTWGFSKDFASNGLRLAAVHCRNPQIKLGCQIYCVFTSFSRSLDRQITKMLQDRSWVDAFLLKANTRLNIAYNAVVERLGGYGINIIPASAGFYVWMDLSKWVKLLTKQENPTTEDLAAADYKLFNMFIANAVYIPNSQGFGYNTSGWYRIIFSMPDEVRDLGIERIFNTLQSIEEDAANKDTSAAGQVQQ